MSIDSNQSHLWTTWEDLLLSCAVKRYGLSDWSNVAMELQSRASKLHFHLFTAQTCCSKFHDLKRRYAGDDAGDVTVPWIDELRNIRIAELRDIVETRGMAIQSLDSKVKRLEEERERNREDNETGEQKPDLEGKICKSDKNDVVLPENDGEFAGDSFSGERSERENRSVNESNSSENQQTGEKMEEKKVDQIKGTEPVQTSDVKRDEPARKPVQADSWNDSSKLIEEKKANNESAKVRDSVATESKGATDGNEAQSSASLTKKSQSSDDSGGGDGDEPVLSESHGKTTSHDSVKNAEPLVRFLNIIRSSKHGSVFVVRLESQKTEMYNGIIKQHMDLETVQTRVSNDLYSSCTAKFYLDLLLLFNNAIVYFPKSSPESSAAFELRKLVLDELRNNNKPSVQQSNSSPESAPSIVIKSEPDAQKTDLLLAKQKITAPCTVSGKRSYITSKPSTSNKTQKQDDNVGSLAKTSSSSRNEEESSLMLMLNEKPVTGARSMRRSSNIRTNNTKTSIKSPISDASVSPGSSTIKESEAPKAENKKKADSVLDFLERLEKSSPAKEEILDTLKSLSDNNNVASSRRGTREQPKKKVNERKESITGRPKRGGGGKHAKEEVSPSKRNVGRPPKRGREAAALPPGKRGKEVLKEEEAPAKRPNKRSKK